MAPRGIVIQITGDGASAAKALELVDQHLRDTATEAQHSASEIRESMEAVRGALETIGLTVGVGEAIEKIKEMISSSIELGVEIGHLSKQTGISTENLSTLKFMSEQTGISFEALTKGFKKLSTEMLGAEEGKKESIQTFARLGITQEEVTKNSHDLMGMLELVADKFQTMPDGPLKAAEAVHLFGKAGMALIPVLDQGRDGIAKLKAEAEALGLVLDEHAIAKLEEMHKAQMQLEASTQGLALALTSALGPALMGAEELVSKAISKFREFLNSENGVADGLRELLKLAGYDFSNNNAGSNVKLPAGLMGVEGAELDAARVRAAQARDAAKAKLDALEEAQKKEGGSIAAFDKKKLALEKDYYDQEKTMYAAMFIDQKDTVARAQADLATAQKKHSAVGSFLGGGDPDLDAAKEKVANAMRLRGELGQKMADADAKVAELKRGKDLSLQDESGASKHKIPSTNSITAAATALAEANATAEAAAQRSADTLLLAQMDADHKLFLISDANYYREKLVVQKDALDSEEAALRSRITDLQALGEKQHGDKKLQRDKSGNSAEELRTQKEILDLQTKIAAIEEKKASLDVNAKLAATERSDAVHLASLKVAAQIEEQTNSGIKARLALMKQIQQDAMQKATAQGGDTANLAALQQQEQELLRINEIEREINQTKAEGALAVAAQKDREEKDPTQRKAATKEINALNKETAATLKDLVAQYDVLAATLGGDFIDKAKTLHAELDKLNRPDQKQDQMPYKNLGEGVTSMAQQMARASQSGKDSFHNMVQSMEQDLVQMAIKFAAQKWLMPFLNGMGKGGGGGVGAGADPGDGLSGILGFAGGGDYSGDQPMIVGEDGPELAFPKGPGTIMPDPELFFPKGAAPAMPAGALSELSRVSGGGQAPNMTMNVTNASSQPVTARQTGSSFDADSKSWMTHVILEDLSQGGPISSALRG